jgi:MATE family multidrug resistance protein
VRRKQWKIKITTFKELLQIGIPSGLQAILETGAFSISAILVGTLGAVSQAAHQIALQCASFTFMISLGLAQGSAIRISNAFGRKNWAEIKRIGRSSFYSAIWYGLVCVCCFIVFRKPISLLFTNDANVILTASTLMIFAAVFQISDATQTVAVGCLRGINDVKMPMIYMAIAYWIIGVPAGCLFTFTFHLGAKGVWIGFVLGLSIIAILLNRRFYKLVKEKTKIQPTNATFRRVN